MTARVRGVLKHSVGNDEKRLVVRSVAPDGDCFYKCVALAYESTNLDDEDEELFSVSMLRQIVAAELTEEQLSSFRIASEAGMREYDHVLKIFPQQTTRSRRKRARIDPEAKLDSATELWATLEEVKHRLILSGKDVGPASCVWADEWSMRVLCSQLSLHILLIDEQAKTSTNRFILLSPTTPVTVDQKSSDNKTSPANCILLQRTRREHMNLILVDSQGITPLNELPEHWKQKWGLPISPVPSTTDATS